MIRPGTRPARLVCAMVVSLAVSALAVGAHVLARGMAPPTLALLPVLAAVSAVTYVVSTRQMSTCGIVALLAVAQLAFHGLSTYLEGPSHHLMSGPDAAAMLIAHGLATLVTAALLASAQIAWWTLHSWLTAWRVALTFTVIAAPRLVRSLVRRADRVVTAVHLRLDAPRGPPALTWN